MAIEVTVPEGTDLPDDPKAWEALVAEDVEAFSNWFSDPARGGGPIIDYERSVLRSYLWWKLREGGNDATKTS